MGFYLKTRQERYGLREIGLACGSGYRSVLRAERRGEFCRGDLRSVSEYIVRRLRRRGFDLGAS